MKNGKILLILQANSTSGIRKEYDAEAAKDNMSSGLKNGLTAQGISGRSASILLTYANPVFPDEIGPYKYNCPDKK